MTILDEIRIYPVKSLPGIRQSVAQVMPKGLQWDRRMMLVDDSGTFMSQRTLPKLSQFALEIQGDRIRITAFDRTRGSIDLPLNVPASGSAITANVWEDEVTVLTADDSINEWFSTILDMPCRLVGFPEDQPRPVDPDYAPDCEIRNVSLADGYPLLIVSRESLNDLNSRLDQPVTIERFRPNLIIRGVEPYGEDELHRFRIGTSIFAGVKRCARCNLITIDPATAVAGQEPLKTLSSYRRQGSKVNFGMNVIPLQPGTLNENDELVLL